MAPATEAEETEDEGVGMAILSATEARALLPGLPATVEDTALDVFVVRVQAALSSYLGYVAHAAGGDPDLEDQTRTFYLRPASSCLDRERRELQLPAYPIVSITSIEVDPTEVFDGSSYLVASTDYDAANATLKNQGIIRLEQASTQSTWGTSDAPIIKVIGVLGWAAVPAPAKHAAAMIVSHWWRQKATFGDTQVTTSKATAAIRTPMFQVPQEARELVNHLRLPGALI